MLDAVWRWVVVKYGAGKGLKVGEGEGGPAAVEADVHLHC